MIGVIVNPNSKRNRKQRNLRHELERKLGHLGVVIETPTLKHLPDALHDLRARGCRYWLADGGDGALHWMINIALEHMGPSILDEVAFIPGNGGTINYVGQAVGLKDRSDQIIDRLLEAFAEGREPETRRLPSTWMYCQAVDNRGKLQPEFNVLGFGCSFAGYGANFFGPFYGGDTARGPLRIVGIATAAFTAGFGQTLLRGPARHLKPRFVREAEHTYLRPIHADAWLDGERYADDRGVPITDLTVAQCSSIPLDLGGVFRVFPFADERQLHVQLGSVTPWEMAKALPGLVTGQSVNKYIKRAYDGPGKTLKIVCHPGNAMTPILDGEVYENIVSIEASHGPRVRIAVV